MGEQEVMQAVLEKFSIDESKANIARERRIFIEVDMENYKDVMAFLKNSLDFTMLCTITGLDMNDHYQLIYHVSDDHGLIVNLKLNIDKSNATVDTITHIYEGTTLYERELVDLFGINVTGLPEGNRYPLPDGWPEGQHPLRKDWKAE